MWTQKPDNGGTGILRYVDGRPGHMTTLPATLSPRQMGATAENDQRESQGSHTPGPVQQRGHSTRQRGLIGANDRQRDPRQFDCDCCRLRGRGYFERCRPVAKRYFRELLPFIHNGTILVFDDIHWSYGMEQAWTNIRNHEAVRCSVDLFFVGLVFFREEFMEKRSFDLRF